MDDQDPSQFRVTRKKSHRLDDLSKFITDNNNNETERKEQKAIAMSSFDSRPSCRPRHRSLVSVRAFYAFGARSASVANKTSYRNYRTDDLYSASASQFIPSYSTKSSWSPCYSTYQSPSTSQQPSALHTPRPERRAEHRDNHESPKPLAEKSWDESKLTLYRPSRNQKSTLPLSPPSSLQIREEVECSSPAPPPPPRPATASTATAMSPAIQQQKEDRGVNTDQYEREVRELRASLREREQREKELRRHLAASDAAVAMWKEKFERTQPYGMEPLVIDIDTSLFDQLDHAADKLARLNAVEDLKLLQNEMHTALLEISK